MEVGKDIKQREVVFGVCFARVDGFGCVLGWGRKVHLVDGGEVGVVDAAVVLHFGEKWLVVN